MSPDDLIELKRLIFITAEYYGKTLSKEVLKMRAEDLFDLPLIQTKDAYHRYRLDPKNKFDPLPSQIREIVQPVVTDDSLAKDAAARISGAVSKFGHTNPDEARKYIGELGWRVVTMVGGWSHICRELGVNLSENTSYAQWRDLAKALIEKQRAGTLDLPPALPEPKSEGFAKLGEVIRQALPPSKELK